MLYLHSRWRHQQSLVERLRDEYGIDCTVDLLRVYHAFVVDSKEFLPAQTIRLSKFPIVWIVVPWRKARLPDMVQNLLSYMWVFEDIYDVHFVYVRTTDIFDDMMSLSFHAVNSRATSVQHIVFDRMIVRYKTCFRYLWVVEWRTSVDDSERHALWESKALKFVREENPAHDTSSWHIHQELPKYTAHFNQCRLHTRQITPRRALGMRVMVKRRVIYDLWASSWN